VIPLCFSLVVSKFQVFDPFSFDFGTG
jgi:hypothetical protein